MKRTKFLVLGLIVALCMSLALCGCSSTSYSPTKKTQAVGSSSLQTDGKLRVGVDASNAPYAVSSSGSIIGIDVDIAAALADELGLELELVDIGSDVAKGFSSEKVDIVMGATSKGDSYSLSNTYLTTGVCLFAKDATSKAPTDVNATFKVSAQASSMSAFSISEHYGDSHLISSSSLSDAFTSLDSGNANYAAADAVIGSYAAHSAKVDAYPIALLEDTTNRCIAVSTKNTDLMKAVNSAIETMNKGGMIKVIEKKWLGSTIDLSSLSKVTTTAAVATEDDSTTASDTTTTTSN